MADSMRTERARAPREGGYVTAAEREASKEEQRCERSGGRADTNGNGEDGWRDASDEGERKSRERESAGTGRTWACEREGRPGG